MEFFGFGKKQQSRSPKHSSPKRVSSPSSRKEPDIVIWTLHGCSHCVMLKKYMDKNKWNYIERAITDKTVKKLQKMIGTSEKTLTAPQVFINGKHIGGVRDTIAYLKKLRL